MRLEVGGLLVAFVACAQSFGRIPLVSTTRIVRESNIRRVAAYPPTEASVDFGSWGCGEGHTTRRTVAPAMASSCLLRHLRPR